VFSAISHAVQSVFVWAVPSAVVVFALAWFVKEVPLRGRAPAPEQPAPELVGWPAPESAPALGHIPA
jgi:hypothetical protein